MLVEFQSVADAVRCAAEVQIRMRRRNSDVPEDRRIQFRIGINLGDIIFDEGDIYGDGVNVAARLEQLADVGGVCVTQAVYDQVCDRIDVGFEDLGEKSLKNISRPMRVWRAVLDEGAPNRRRAGGAARRGVVKPVDRGDAVRQHERRSRAGIFRRRPDRGHHHRAVAPARAVRHLAQLHLRLQGAVGEPARDR